jgi:hypothetical protein
MEQHEGISYRVTKVPKGWRWTIFLGTDIQIDGRESTEAEATQMAKQTIEDFLWRRSGPQ